MLERARNLESHSDKLPEIIDKFRGITRKFENGHYKSMIVGELQKNYVKINEMAVRLGQELRENEALKEKVKKLEADEEGMELLGQVRSVVDDREAMIIEYDDYLKNSKTMIAENNHIDIEEHIVDFFQ